MMNEQDEKRIAELEYRVGALETAVSAGISSATRYIAKALEDMSRRLRALEGKPKYTSGADLD